VQLPLVDAISPSIIARNVPAISITGRFFRPTSDNNLLIEFLVHGSVVQGSFVASSESLTAKTFSTPTPLPFDASAPANADLIVRISTTYGITSEHPIGTVYRAPVNLTFGVESFFGENSTLIIRGDGFNESDLAAHQIVLRQAASAPECTLVAVSSSELRCAMRDPLKRPGDGLIFAQVSVYGGRPSQEAQIGTYTRSLINRLWKPEEAIATWRYMNFALNQTSNSADIEIPPLNSGAAIASVVAPLFGLSTTDLDVRYQLTTAFKVLVTVYFSNSASQARYDASSPTSNATLLASVTSAVQTALSGTSYTVLFSDGTTTGDNQIFSGPAMAYSISSATATVQPNVIDLTRVRNRTASLLQLTLNDVSLRMAVSAKRALQRDLSFFFPTASGLAVYIASGVSRNTSLQTSINQIIEGGLPGWTSRFVSATDVAAPLDQTAATVVPLAPGSIAAIAVAAVVFVAILIVGIVIFGRRYRRMQAEKHRAEQTAAEIPKQFEEMMGNWSIKSSDIEIGKKLGEGSFGAVFKGAYKGKPVAIKKLAANMLGAQVSAFFQEAATMFAIKPSKNVVRMYGMCQEMGNLQMVRRLMIFPHSVSCV
jgi:uncharacterized membrane protein YciS (DUF1049 family)